MIKDWTEIAQQEFDAMPQDYQSDWRDLRQSIME